jgi:NADH-quinone oxidoreductase subunit E
MINERKILMNNTVDFNTVDKILNNHENKASSIIAILQDIQSEYRYLPEEVFTYISKKLNISAAKVFSVATFYDNFSLVPKGKYVFKVCDGTACHVRKSIPILEQLRKELNLSDIKHTTDDMMFTIETVSCLGACGLAPVLTLNDKVYAAMTPQKASELLKELGKAELK